MEKFLFSRSHKKHYSDAVVRMGKNNLGFSLVELIIVIAIMAILAAIAIPVFGVFIQKAEKSNDQNVIKDIVYAIDLANESGAFMEEETMSIGDVKYPAGFVVINAEGIKVITSTTTVAPADPCNFKTITYSGAAKNGTQNSDCKKDETKDKYKYEENLSFTYCVDHSDVSVITTALSEYDTGLATEYAHSGDDGLFSCRNHSFSAVDTVKIPAGKTIITDISKLYGVSSNPQYCTANYKNSTGTIQVGTIEANTNNAIYYALEDVFGKGFESTLKLTSADWGGEGTSHVTLYTYAPQMFEKVEEIGDLLVDLQGLKDLSSSTFGPYFTGDYEDTGELVSNFSQFLVTNKTPEQWDVAWAEAAGADTEYYFQLTGCGNDYLWAARMMYNNAFASYCQTKGVADKYTNVIANYGENAYNGLGEKAGGGFLGGLVTSFLNGVGPQHADKNIPSVVNTAAFTDSNGLLKSQFGDSADDIAAFEKCAALYEEYKTSSVCTENGRAIYQTMGGVADTSNVAQATGDYFGYYEAYLNEMSELYEVAQREAGANGVIIIVYVEEGIATCEISPAAADFRNKQ